LLQQSEQSQAVAIHTELDSKAPTTAHKLRTEDKIKTLRAIGLLKHTHTHTHTHTNGKGEKENTHKSNYSRNVANFAQQVDTNITAELIIII